MTPLSAPNDTVSLSIPALAPYMKLLSRFVETCGEASGLVRPDCISLELATEEVFMYMTHTACPGNTLNIECRNGIYYSELIFRCSAADMNLRGLNIVPVAAPSLDDECDLTEIGLLMAARSVDRLQITMEKHNQIMLCLTKEKTYPRIVEEPPTPETVGSITVETPDPERIKHFSLLVGARFPEQDRPSFFHYPGKLVDMVAGGKYHCLIAMDARKNIQGGILFFPRTEKIVECFGPYVFVPAAGVGEALLDACIGKIARGKALGLLNSCGLPRRLENNFEALGHQTFYPTDGPALPVPSFYRHLHEDPGAEVWSHACLESYLTEHYRRLYLMRRIRLIRDMQETRSGFSLFTAEIGHEQSRASLSPLLPGADCAQNLARHIRFIAQERIRNIFFTLDLDIPWHAELMPFLLGQGFRPQMIMPFAGRSDLLVFQYHDDAQS